MQRGESKVDTPWLYEVPIWVNGALFLVVLFLAIEVGYRVGLRQHRSDGDEKRKTRGDVTLGSMLALLGLMLAFTYAFSLSRADMRKQAMVQEANAIGTAFLRADLAAEPGRSELRALLLDYARTRVVTDDMIRTHEKLMEVVTRSEEAQSALWPATKRLMQGDLPDPLKISIVQAVNDVLDAQTKRVAVVFDRLPGVVVALLVLIAATSLAVAAHNAGLNGRMSRWRMSAFAIVLAALMLVILDFDQGKRGLIQISDHPLKAVIHEMEHSIGIDR
jgi:hypothetical protein